MTQDRLTGPIISRRKMLAGSVAVAASWPQLASGQTNAAQRRANEETAQANTAAAMSLTETVEPVLSMFTASNLQRAIANYEAFIAANGSWDAPVRDMFNLKIGASRRSVSNLKRRLMVNGDMPFERRATDDFDRDLDAGLRAFQVRHGLIPSGVVDEATFYALAVPADQRLNQLRLNARRVEYWAKALSDRYVVVNIPAANIEAVEGGQVVLRHTAVVGKVDRATPILNSKVHQVKFNPFWTVPKSIIEKDMIRYMNDDPEYLTKFQIRIFDGRGNELRPDQIDWSTNDAVQYTFRQDPGPENSLGRCKIDFYNKHAVYLHDTPQKALFGENTRFYSSGCVRVERVEQLVAWLLRDNGGWNVESVVAAFESGVQNDVPLKVQVPIHTTYITAWANGKGTVSFRDDVYGFDAQGVVEFEV